MPETSLKQLIQSESIPVLYTMRITQTVVAIQIQLQGWGWGLSKKQTVVGVVRVVAIQIQLKAHY